MTDPLAFDFSGHTVLISGASRGIGAATARAFAAQGAAVALLARDADALAGLAAPTGNGEVGLAAAVRRVRHAMIQPPVGGEQEQPL